MTANHGRRTVVTLRCSGFHHSINYWILLLSAFLSRFPPRAACAAANLQPPPPPGEFPFYTKPGTSSPATMIILICIMTAFLLMSCISVYLRQCAARRRMSLSFTLPGGGGSAAGLDQETINAFPTFVYSEVKELRLGKGGLECAVCINEFEDDETLRLLPHCSHVFHADCIDAWLSSHFTCPVCRADLDSKPGDSTLPLTVPSQHSDSELSHDSHSNQNSDRLVVDIDVILPAQSPGLSNHHTPRRSTPRRNAAGGGGELLVKAGEDCERYTLRLPEEVRSRLVGSSGLNRTRSCVAFPRERSWRKGYRSSSGGTGRGRNFFYFERSDRWEFMVTPPPPPISRAGSVRWPKAVSGGESSTSTPTRTPKNLLKSVTSPLYRLFGGRESKEEGVNVWERSVDRLRLDGQV